MVYAEDLKSLTRKGLWVRVPPPAPEYMDFPYGKLVDKLPEGFFPPDIWPEFGSLATPVAICSREEVGKDPKGVRWSFWPVTIEEYIGDKEPRLEDAYTGALTRNRMVRWLRLSNVPVPKGWFVERRPWRVDGFYLLDPTKPYINDWKKSARRDLREWQKKYTSFCRIEAISFEEYEEAYKHSTVAKKTTMELMYMLKRKREKAVTREHSTLWGVRDLRSGKIIAGNVNYYSPTFKSSVREFPFILPEARGGHASVALVDHWMSEALKRGHYKLIATHFWQPGESKSWQGFSAFKAQFGYTFVAYPPALYRFVRGKLF